MGGCVGLRCSVPKAARSRLTSSLALIAWGFLQPESEGIGMQNVVLLAINGFGVWRYLLSPSRRARE